ncbi:MAG: SDR family NAD(P)-dependent oxidoreductase [Pseudomonadota bacterium]
MASISSDRAGNPSFEGRHVVVTGAGRGIGAAIADRLAAGGATLSLTGRGREAIERRAEALPDAIAVPMDVTNPASVEEGFMAIVKRQGPVDILVNNAGAAESARFVDSDDALWQRMLAVNLHGPRACIGAVLPGMLDRGWGRIVTVASTAGLKGYAYTTAYCAAKHAVVGLTRALALEMARTGVTVNAVCPGFTDTDLVSDSIAEIERKTGRTKEQALKELTRFNPQGRLIDPTEIAAAVAYLCSNEAAGMTGQALAIAGGEVMS